MELAELLPQGVTLDDDLVAWARGRADALLAGRPLEEVLASLGADNASSEAGGRTSSPAIATARPREAAAALGPRARAITPPPLPPAGGPPRARAMTPMPPPPPRDRAMTPIPPPPPSLVSATGGDGPPLERAATMLDPVGHGSPSGGARDDGDELGEDVELLEVDAEELELLDDDGDDADVAPEAPSLRPGASLEDEPLPDDQKTNIALAPHLREPSGPLQAAQVREDTNRFALPEDAAPEDTAPDARFGEAGAAIPHTGAAIASVAADHDDGITSGVLDDEPNGSMSDVRAAPSSSSAQEMVLEDVDPSSFGLGFGQDDAPGAPIRTGGTQRLTTVDAPIDDGLDDDDDDIDIDLD